MDTDDVIYTLRVYFPDAPNTDKPGLRLSESSPRSWDEQVMDYLEDMCMFIPELEAEYHTGPRYLADATRMAKKYEKVIIY
jgi:hypothetical protein